MKEAFYPVVVVALADEDGGGYAAYAPDLYGCMSDGETPEEAIANLRDAIVEWCDETRRLGRPVPEPGSFAREIGDERRKLVDLIRRQDELLQSQAELSQALRADLQKLRAALDAALAGAQPSEGDALHQWVSDVARVPGAVEHGRKSGIH
ncbi:type II toxin-antitoxin system HicB family antitoxin [Alsobacter sp. SYSU M60028]|uniref:Type II toxin-antitoxin system HicB family antitoxin n=1 Tax=Alsobacter ponti TaxID=2962936 RepID=A0ABT1L896_9HYPH|nr:type II toxin-antitoxin system HicB family antitoxin [Alsobacter ponti]MCP8937726.1 type II toxin-antitoxin system HicB family antitoxin [Alsobacter ponti]